MANDRRTRQQGIVPHRNIRTSIEGAGHNQLRATNVDVSIKKLEDSLTLKGLVLKQGENEILAALQSGHGLITSDEEVYALAKFYVARTKVMQGLAHLCAVEYAIHQYFNFDELSSEIRRAAFASYPQGVPRTTMTTYDVLSELRKGARGHKPLLSLHLRFESAPPQDGSILEPLLALLRTSFVTREICAIVFAQRKNDVPHELSAKLQSITPGGYFS